MTNSERLKKSMQIGESRNTLSPASASNSSRLQASMTSKEYGFDTLGRDEAYIRKLVTDSYGGWQDKTTLNANYAQVQGIANRLNAYKQNSSQASPDLDKIIDFYNGALSNWDKMAQTYGNFVNADAYNKAVRQSDLEKKYAGKNYDQIQKAYGKATDVDEHNFLKNYSAYSDEDSFQRAIEGAYNDDYKKKLEGAYSNFRDAHAWDRYSDITQSEDFDSAVDGVKKVGDSYMFEADLIRSGRGNNVEILNKMTDEEKQVAAYIYQKDGIDAVADYLSDMGMLVGKRYYDDKVSEEAQKIEETEGWQGAGLNAWYSVRDALINAIGSAGATGEVIQSYASGKDYNPYIGMSGWSNRAGDTTAAISNEITDVTSPVLGDSKFNLASMAYNAVVSDLASKAGQFALGQMYTPLMGGSAYASTYKDAIEKGLDKESAKLTALASGAAEAIFEYLSFGNLQALQPKNTDSIKTILTNMAKQFVGEGSEEVLTDIANMATDYLINGDMSEISGIYQSYINAGYDQNSAKLYTMLAKGGDVLESFIVGGMSGAMGAGLASAMGYASNKEMGANADRDLLSKAFEGNEELTRRFNEADTDAKVGALMGDVYRESIDNSVDALANYIMGNSDVSKRKAIKLAEASLRSGFTVNDEGVQKTIEENSRIAKGVNESVRTAKEKAEAEAKTKAFNEKADVSKFNVTEDAELSKVTDINGDTLTVNGEEKPVSEVAMNVDQANIVSIASTLSGAEKETYLEMYRGQDSEAYDDIFKTVWDSAMNGIDINDIRSAFRTETLFTGNEIDKIYLSALKVREAEGIKNYEARKALTANLKNNFKSGRFDDSNLKKQNYVITDEKQRVAYEIAKVFSKLGANVRVIYDVSIAGKHSADNGFFTSKGNVVTINLAAKYNVNDTTDKGYAINTLAHEFTHFIEYNNKEGFETIRNALVRVYGKKKWEQLKTDNARLYGIKSAKEAESEAVARACEDMLNSPETMDMILSKMNANEIKTFRDAVKSFFDHLISMWKKVANTFSSEAPASKALAEEIAHYEEIRSLWVDALTEALKTAQATEKDLKAIGMEMRNGYVYNVLSAQTLEKSDYMTDIKKAAKSLAKAQGISENKAKEQIQNMLRARDIILSDEERLNYTSIEGKSAWVSNPEYGGNLDFSFLCPKRLPYTGTLNAIMHKHPKLNFSVDNFLWLRRALIEEGVDAPCPYCFVESSRARFGKYNDRFLQIAKEEKLDYIPTHEDLLNPDVLERMRSEHPETYDRYQKYLGTLAQRKPKMLEERRAYDGDILRVFGKGDDKIDEKNLHGGIRFNAFSDFEIVHMLDCMQAIADMARIGLAGFAYTKQKAFAEIFGQTGLKINLSCAAKGVDADGRIIFDDVEGMNHNDAEELRNTYSQNVGICCVVFTREQLEAALIDERIDYVLPFHRSQWSKKEYERMGLSIDTEDFTRSQTEKAGATGTKKVKDGNMPFLSYWNNQLSGRENVEKYLDICNRNDIRPLFSFVLDFVDGKWQIPEGGRRQMAAENYWKLLTEFKMFDNEGNHISHNAVRADFNMEAAERLLNSYDGSHSEFPVNQNVVDHFDVYMKKGKSGYEFEKDFKLHSKQLDSEGNALSEEQVEFFKESIMRDDKGNLIVFYHGSKNSGFVVFDPRRADDKRSLFFTDNRNVAASYSGVSYVENLDKPMSFDELSNTLDYIGDGDYIVKEGNAYVVYDVDDNVIDRFASVKEAQAWMVDTHIAPAAEEGIGSANNYSVYLNAKNPLIIDAGRHINGNVARVTFAFYEGMLGVTYWTEIGNFSQKVAEADISSYSQKVFGSNVLDDAKGNLKEFGGKYNVYELRDVDVDVTVGQNWNDISYNGMKGNTRTFAEYAEQKGYDGVIFKNLIDNGGYTNNDNELSTIAVVFNANQVKSTDNTNPTSDPDIRHSKQIDPETIPAEKYEEMKSHFGTTTNFNVAGYMLKDGTMLDFSGKHWGDTSSTFRQVDHRDVQEVLDDTNGMNGVGSMITMISNGNIRLMPENGGINLSEMPNEAQIKVLERYIQNRLTHEDRIVTLDFDEYGGDTVYSKFYEAGKGVSAQSIIADIKDYFENGQRSQSTVAQFHNMYSKQITDEKLLKNLNDQIARGEYITTYKSMRLDNGALHSPMAAFINGKFENEYKLGEWYEAVEHPEDMLVKVRLDGKVKMLKALEYPEYIKEDGSNLFFNLDKGKGEDGKKLGNVPARYNPYEHSSNYVLNDQFSSAYKRPELVTVEMRIPKSELTSGYRAQFAKDSVGWKDWKTGDVATALAQRGKVRKVVLSRYAMPVRIVPDKEVAQRFKELLEGTDVVVPTNVVTPSLLKELKQIGVPTRDTINVQYSKQLDSDRKSVDNANPTSDNDDIRYSTQLSDKEMDKYIDQADAKSRLKNGQYVMTADGMALIVQGKNLVYLGGNEEGKLKANYVVTIYDENNMVSYVDQKILIFFERMAHNAGFRKHNRLLYFDAYEHSMLSLRGRRIQFLIRERQNISKFKGGWFDEWNGRDGRMFEGIDGSVTSEPINENFLARGGDYFSEEAAREIIRDIFSDYSRNSKQLDDTAYDILGENKRLVKENNKLRKDVERLAEALKLSKTVTNGKMLRTSQVEAAAESIKKLANSTYDTKNLTEELKGLYGYLLDNANAKDKTIDFDEFIGRAYDIAGRVLSESKGNKVVDPYYKGLLNNFRNTRIRLTDEQIQEAKNAYGDDYRNAFMGSIILAKNGTSLDSLWQEWSAQYPELFSADTNPNDMPTALLEAISTIRSSATIVESYNTQEARLQLAYDIYNKFWNVDTVRTFADKAMAEHRKAMAELKSDYKTRLEKQALQKDWEKAKVIHEVKKQRDQKLADYKEYVKKRKIDEKEASEKRVLIRKITDTSAELNKWLLANNKDKHVPEGLKVPLASLLDAIDFSSKQMYNTGVPTRRDISFINALERMHTMIMQESEALTTADGMTELDLTSDFAQSVDALYKDISHVERQVREDNGYILQAMSADELSRLYDMIKVLKHSITQMNKMISSSNAHRMDTVALKTIGDAKELGETRTPEAIRRYDYGEALPYYTFKRMGEGGKIVFENFMDGQDTMAFHAREIKDYAESVYSDDQVKEWEKDIREFTVGDKTFEITVPQIMSLYCLSKRDQARQHILQGGIRIDEFKKGFKKVNQTQNINLSASDLSEIIGTLTDEQREVADRLQEFLNTTCSDWGNEITMKRFGIKGFTEKNYFPIRSNDAKLQSDAKDRSASLYALLNMSFTKGLVVKANNQIIVSDVFDVFAKHSSDMARYNAFSLPVLDLIRWWNYKVHSDNERGFEDETVKSALEATFGREMNHYIRTFIDDVNGTKQKGRMDNLSSKMLTAYKIAAVGANLQVALLQPISYIRAAYVIDTKYLTQGLLRKPNTNDARQYVGMMVWKDMGFFELDVTNGLQDIIKHADTAGDKIKELSMKGAELGDTLTWGFLWNACEAEVADKRHDLVRGSEEFKKAVAKRMREVIYSTQVVDSVFTRSQFMRGGDMYTKMLTAFLSEPTLSLNVLRDAYEGYAQDVKRYGKAEAWKRNGKNIGMAFGTYVICAVVESTLRGVIGKLRDPEDEEIGKLIWDNVKSELNPLGKLPYFKDIVEMMEGYSPTRMDESVIQQGVWTYKAIVKGEWDYATWYKIFKFSSQVSGLPLSNAMREATTIWNDTAGLMYPSIRIE